MYQTCTEFGFFQTSTARPNLFSETFPVDFFIQQCVDVFGPRSALNTIMNLFLLRCRYIINALLYFNRYSIHLLNSAVDRTNILYGALNLKVTNVVFVHGSVDPWHVLGIKKSSDSQAPAIYINGINNDLKYLHIP